MGSLSISVIISNQGFASWTWSIWPLWSLLQSNRVLILHCLLGPVLLTLSDSLEEMRSFFGVIKQQPNQTLFDLKSMEKRTILVVLESYPQLLVPDNTTVAIDVHKLQEKCVTDQIINQCYGTRQACVGPLLRVRIGNV